MTRVTFAKAIQRHVDCPAGDVEGDTVCAALDAYFGIHPAVRRYVLDDQNEVRRHIAVFVDNDLITDRVTLADPVKPTSTTRGNWSSRSGTNRPVTNGSAEASMTPACTRSASTREGPVMWSSACRAVAPGVLTTVAQLGRRRRSG